MHLKAKSVNYHYFCSGHSNIWWPLSVWNRTVAVLGHLGHLPLTADLIVVVYIHRPHSRVRQKKGTEVCMY
jgi:hypothetical protein